MWYILQTFIVCLIIYAYTTKLSPEANLGHIILFGFMVAYGCTWVLAKTFDLIRSFFRLLARWC